MEREEEEGGEERRWGKEGEEGKRTLHVLGLSQQRAGTSFPMHTVFLGDPREQPEILDM